MNKDVPYERQALMVFRRFDAVVKENERRSAEVERLKAERDKNNMAEYLKLKQKHEDLQQRYEHYRNEVTAVHHPKLMELNEKNRKLRSENRKLKEKLRKGFTAHLEEYLSNAQKQQQESRQGFAASIAKLLGL